MSDNVAITPGAGASIATHQESSDGAQLQRVIPNAWAGGVATDVSAAAPLPVATTGNQAGTLLASAAQTATLATAAQANTTARGVIVTVNVTAVSGTGPTLVASVQAQDPVSLAWYPLNAAATAISAAGLYTFAVYPGATGGAVTQATGLPLPQAWRVSFTIAGTTPSFTFSAGYSYVI